MSEDYRIKEILDYVDGNLVHKEKDIFYVRQHRPLREEQQSCSTEECPDMYFENYDDYEKYEEERLNKPTYE